MFLIETSGPNIISISITSPTEEGWKAGWVLHAVFLIMAKSPGSSIASAGKESRWIVSQYNCLKCFFIMSVQQKPTLAQRKSSDIVMIFGRDMVIAYPQTKQ